MFPAIAYLSGWTEAIASLLPPPKMRRHNEATGYTRLNALIRKASLPRWSWPSSLYHGNPILRAREMALRARGYGFHSSDPDGYVTWVRPDFERDRRNALRLGPYGAVYLGRSGWEQMPRDEREELTEEGRVLLLAEAERDERRIREARRNA